MIEPFLSNVQDLEVIRKELEQRIEDYDRWATDLLRVSEKHYNKYQSCRREAATYRRIVNASKEQLKNFKETWGLE
jgi:hypothetical protein